jgi:hypothetical protein
MHDYSRKRTTWQLTPEREAGSTLNAIEAGRNIERLIQTGRRTIFKPRVLKPSMFNKDVGVGRSESWAKALKARASRPRPHDHA